MSNLLVHPRKLRAKSSNSKWSKFQVAEQLSLDFGARQFVIEGSGLDELVRYLQLGAVMAAQEYAGQIWPARPSGAVVTAINKITGQ